MINKLKKILKNNKGLNTIETAILSVIILTCIGGLIDLNSIMKKFNATSSTASYISRTIAKQGGVRINKVPQYNGDYVTSRVLYNDVKKILNDAGVKDSEFTVKIDGTLLSPSTNLPIRSYGTSMKVELNIRYKWNFISQVTGVGSFNKSSHRTVNSTFKNRTADDGASDIQ